MGDIIIGTIIFVAFFRAAGEYKKNGWAWGGIGIASFFIPSLILPFLVTIVLTAAGAGKGPGQAAFSLAGLISFGLSLLTVVWTYNKLMELAIEAQAVRDAQAFALTARSYDNQANTD
jgi:hypothetical protein